MLAVVRRLAALPCVVIASFSQDGANQSSLEMPLSEARQLAASGSFFESKIERLKDWTGDSIMEGATGIAAIANIFQEGPSFSSIGEALSQTSKFIGFTVGPPAGWILGLLMGSIGGIMVNHHNARQDQPPTTADVISEIQKGFQHLAGKLDDLSTQVGLILEVVNRIEGLLKDYTVFHMDDMYEIQYKYGKCLERFQQASEPNQTWMFSYFRGCVSNVKAQLDLHEQAVQPSNLQNLLLSRLKGRKTFCDAADIYKLVVSTRMQLCQLYVWQAAFKDESLTQLINRDVEVAITDMRDDMAGYQEVLKNLGGDGWSGRELQLAIEGTDEECRSHCYGLSCGQQASGFTYDNCECRCSLGWTHSMEFDSDVPNIEDGLLYRDCDMRAASCDSNVDSSMTLFVDSAHTTVVEDVGRKAHKNWFGWFNGQHTLTIKGEDMTAVYFRLAPTNDRTSSWFIISRSNPGKGEVSNSEYYLRKTGNGVVDFAEYEGMPGGEARWILQPTWRFGQWVRIKNVASNEYVCFERSAEEASLTHNKDHSYNKFRFSGCGPEYKPVLSGGRFLQPEGVPADPKLPDWATTTTTTTTTTTAATTTTTTAAATPDEPSVFSKSMDSTCTGSKADLLRAFPGSEALCKAKCLQLNCQAFLRVRTGIYAGKCFFRGGQASSPVAFSGRDCFTREMYTKHADMQCVGSLQDLQRSFAGSAESCQAKCSELGCKGFIRVRSGIFAGKCFFRGGAISSPVPMSGRDCFTQVVHTVPYTAHAESQCTGSAGDLQRAFTGSEESCKLKCNEIACNGFIRVTGGVYAGQCFFRGGTVSRPVSYPGRTCFMLGGADTAVVYTKRSDTQCLGSLGDTVRAFIGTEEACKAKCSEMKCPGFIRVRSGTYAGQCFFRGGSIKSSKAMSGRDCYVPSA